MDQNMDENEQNQQHLQNEETYQQYQQQSEGMYQQYQQQSEGMYQQYQQQNEETYQQYQQPGMEPYPQYGSYHEKPKTSGIGFGIASMIMGIVSLILFCSCINIPVAIAAIIFGIIYLSGQPESKVYGIVGIVTASLSIIFFGMMIMAIRGPVSQYYHDIDNSFHLQLPGYHDNEYDQEFDDIFDPDFEFEDFG